MRHGTLVLFTGVVGVVIGGLATGISFYLFASKESPMELPDFNEGSPKDIAEYKTVVANNTSKTDVGELDPIFRIQSIHDSTKFSTDFDQSVSLYVLLARATEDDLERYISESLSIWPRNQRVAALSITFGRYGAIDPKKALERALTLDQLTMQEKSNVIRSIFNEWTVGDLEGAVASMEELPQQFKFSAASAIMWRSDFLSPEQRTELARQIGPNDAWIDNAIASIRSDEAKVDPRTAFYDHIQDTAHTQKHYMELFGIVRHWFERDGAAILPELHESLENPNARRFVLQNLIWNAIATKTATPVELLDVVAELPNQQDAQQAMEHVFRSWSNMDPKQSFEASLEFADKLVTHEFRNSLLRTWAVKDFDGLLTEASTLPREYQDTAIVHALGHMSINEPDEAIRYARNLGSRKLRISARDEIVAQWSIADAKAAFEWLLSDGFDKSNRSYESLIRIAFTRYLQQDFDAAKTFASNYEGESRDQLIRHVANHLVDSDIDLAIEYLPNVNEEDRVWLQEQIGSELVRLDPNRALRFADSISKNHRESFFRRMLYVWAREDLISLHENVKRIPREYQAIAADALLHLNEEQRYLTDRQIRQLEAMTTKEELIVTSGE